MQYGLLIMLNYGVVSTWTEGGGLQEDMLMPPFKVRSCIFSESRKVKICPEVNCNAKLQKRLSNHYEENLSKKGRLIFSGLRASFVHRVASQIIMLLLGIQLMTLQPSFICHNNHVSFKIMLLCGYMQVRLSVQSTIE